LPWEINDLEAANKGVRFHFLGHKIFLEWEMKTKGQGRGSGSGWFQRGTDQSREWLGGEE